MIRGSRSVLDGSNIGQPGGEGTREYGSGKWLGWMMRDAAGRYSSGYSLAMGGMCNARGSVRLAGGTDDLCSAAECRSQSGAAIARKPWPKNSLGSWRSPLRHRSCGRSVVVHGRGVATWLEQFLAQRLGVCAQIEFLFPGKFVARLFGVQAAIEGRDAPRLQQREQWFWTALGVLDELESAGSDDLAFEPLRAYLAHSRDVGAGAWRCSLAQRIAQAFDQYAIFRPDWVRDWDRGGWLGPGGKPLAPGLRWQAALWRRVVGGDRADGHVGELVQRFENWRRTDSTGFCAGLRAAVPDRVFLFGLTSLPPSYLQVMAHAAHALPTGAMLMSPSNQFWTDAPRRRKRKRDYDAEAEGNPLVSAFGLLGAEFAELWEAAVGAGEHEMDPDATFAPADQETVLGTLQDDVLHLHHVAKDGEGPVQGSLFPGEPSPDGRVQREPLPIDDTSLSVHSCHGPTREIEVLHDQLLACIDRGVAPHEIRCAVARCRGIRAAHRGGVSGRSRRRP